MIEEVRRRLRPLSKQEKQKRKLSALESRASSLEEKATYAEKEAQVRKRIRDAEDKIRENQPRSAFDFDSVGSLWGRVPTPIKFFSVIGLLVVVLLLVGKACTGSG